MKARGTAIFLGGLLFGLGLAISGMTDPSRVTGFLDVAGDWDPSLAYVMGGAVGTLGIGLLGWRRRAEKAGLFGVTLPEKDQDPVDRRLVIGMAIFGIGWGLSGFCPGPAIANLAALHGDSLAFVPAMAAGMWLERRLGGAKYD